MSLLFVESSPVGCQFQWFLGYDMTNCMVYCLEKWARRSLSCPKSMTIRLCICLLSTVLDVPNNPLVYAQVSNMVFSHEISEPHILYVFLIYCVCHSWPAHIILHPFKPSKLVYVPSGLTLQPQHFLHTCTLLVTDSFI